MDYDILSKIYKKPKYLKKIVDNKKILMQKACNKIICLNEKYLKSMYRIISNIYYVVDYENKKMLFYSTFCNHNKNKPKLLLELDNSDFGSIRPTRFSKEDEKFVFIISKSKSKTFYIDIESISYSFLLALYENFKYNTKKKSGIVFLYKPIQFYMYDIVLRRTGLIDLARLMLKY